MVKRTGRDKEEKGCVGLNTLMCVTVWEHFCWGLKSRSFVCLWVHPRLCTLGCHEATMTPPWTFSFAPSPSQCSLQEPELSMKDTRGQRGSLVWAANHFEKELVSLFGFAGTSVASWTRRQSFRWWKLNEVNPHHHPENMWYFQEFNQIQLSAWIRQWLSLSM